MELKYLRLVKNIVELGSMAKSKDKLCLTQSALSHQLKEAESQSATALFVRRGKKLILTAAGEMVYKAALDILPRMDNLEREMQEIARGEKGVIRLCTACFTNYYWLPGLVEKFRELHPQIEVKIYPEYINETMPRLLNHELDAVIMNKPVTCKDVIFHEIMLDELVAVVPPGHSWTQKKIVKASDFETENLIVFSKPMETVVVYDKVLKPAGVTPMHVYEVPMTEAMVEMVVAGMGVAVIPHWIARPYIEASKVASVRVTSKGLFRSLGLALLTQDAYPCYYNTLIDFLKERISLGSR